MSKSKAVKSLNLENFSVLPNTNFEFSPQLNVIMAENGCGKSHLLKLIYSLLEVTSNPNNELSKTNLETQFANKLINVFRPDSLGSLVKKALGLQGIIEELDANRRALEILMKKSKTENDLDYEENSNTGDNPLNSKKANIKLTLLNEEYYHIKFSNMASKKVVIEKLINSYSELPIFIPSRELITLCPWFVSLYLTNSIPFEETWFDTCKLLTAPLLKDNERIKDLLSQIEKAMDGSVLEKQGRFYLRPHRSNRTIEAPLVAEGLRKFVMIARLIATGALLDKGYLFWDEPEANLNPKLIKVAARIIWSLSQQGIQVFIATHSLFLLRELELLNFENKTDLPVRFFSLVASDDGTKVEQGDSINDLDTLILLDESIMQADRYLNI